MRYLLMPSHICESAILARRVATRARLVSTRDLPHRCSSVPPIIIFTERLNLTITIAGAICCLIPATLITSHPHKDSAFLKIRKSKFSFHHSAVPSIITSMLYALHSSATSSRTIAIRPLPSLIFFSIVMQLLR